MKHLENVQLLSYNGENLIQRIVDEGKGTVQIISLTVRELFIYAAKTFKANDIESYKVPLEALRALEVQSAKDDNYVHLEDEWYKILRACIDTKISLEYGINSVIISDTLDKLITEGKPLEKVTDNIIDYDWVPPSEIDA